MVQGYREWRREKERISLWLVGVQLLLMMAWSLWVGLTQQRLYRHEWLGDRWDVTLFWLVMIALVIAHEGAHWLGQRWYGVRCRLVLGWWGVGIAPLGTLVREQKLWTLLLPHLLLTPPLLLAMWLLPLHAVAFWCGVAAGLNTILGLHDFASWVQWYRLPRGSRVTREGRDVIIYVPQAPLPFQLEAPE